MNRPINNLIVGQELLQPFPVGVTNQGGNIATVPIPTLLGGSVPAPAVTAPAVTSYPPSSYMAPQAATMGAAGASPQPSASQPYDDAIMRNARGIGLLGQTPTSSAVQAQTGLLSNFFGTSFEDPRTRRNLAGAAALLQAGGPQTRPVGTGQAVGMGIEAMLKQQNEMDKLKKISQKGLEAKGPYVRKGTNEYLGEGVFNPTTGVMQLSTPSGQLIPLPADAEPTVKSFLSRDAAGASNVIKLEQTVAEHEKSLGQLTDYLSGFEDRNTGFKLLADQFSTGLKTFFDSGDLTPAQFAAAYQNGQLQGLLGAQRLSVVGGGVMTEQDALRVISALGGDITALQNPEIVEAQIQRIYNERYQLYKSDIGILNRQRSIYGQGQKPIKQNPFTSTGTLSSSAGDVGFTFVGEE